MATIISQTGKEFILQVKVKLTWKGKFFQTIRRRNSQKAISICFIFRNLALNCFWNPSIDPVTEYLAEVLVLIRLIMPNVKSGYTYIANSSSYIIIESFSTI